MFHISAAVLRWRATPALCYDSITVLDVLDMLGKERHGSPIGCFSEVVVFVRDHTVFVFVILSFATVIPVPASLARPSPSLDFWGDSRATFCFETRLLRTLCKERTLG